MINFIANYADKMVGGEVRQSNKEELINWLSTKTIIAVDTETQGDFNFSNKVIMLQIGDADEQFVIDTRDTDVKFLAPYFSNAGILKLFHNAKFDLKFLRYCFGFDTQNVYDTFLVECLLTNGKRGRTLNLADVTNKYTGAYMDKSVRLNFLKKGTVEFTTQEIVYSGRDVEYLHAIRDAQLKEVEVLELNNVVDLENEAVHVFADIEYNGMKLDANRWVAQADKTEDLLKERKKELDYFILDNYPKCSFIKGNVQLTMFDTDPVLLDINWDSPVQMKQLFLELGIPVKTTSAKDIVIFEDKYEIISKFIAYKKTAKLVSTYGKNFLTYINPVTERVHTNFWQILDTARVSSGGSDTAPNMQNLPASNDYRNPFVARPGWKIVSCDFSGQEARLAASGSQDPTWVTAFKEGKDLHSEVAALVFGIEVDKARDKPAFLQGKSYRDVAKMINFAILYGAGEHKIAKSLNISKDQAKKIIDKYFEATPKLIQYLNNCAAYGIKNGYIRSFKPYSFVRFLDGWYPGITREADEKTYERLKRICFNSPIQSTGAYMMKKALIELRKYIRENKLTDKVKIIMVVHDQADIEVKAEFAEEWAQIQKSIMEAVGNTMVKNISILSEITIGDAWSK